MGFSLLIGRHLRQSSFTMLGMNTEGRQATANIWFAATDPGPTLRFSSISATTLSTVLKAYNSCKPL
jgi:hypothetical protein